MPDATVQIAVEDGTFKLGDTIVPGIYQGLEISGEVALDEQAVPGRSGSSKQPLGFKDAEVTLRVMLVDDDETSAEDKLRVLVGLFKGQDAQAKPFVYRLVCPSLAAWKIDQVVFRGLRSAESSDNDVREQELVFVEHKPVTLKAEKRRSQLVPTAAAAGYIAGGQVTQMFGDFAAPTAEQDAEYEAAQAAKAEADKQAQWQQEYLLSESGSSWDEALRKADKRQRAEEEGLVIEDDDPAPNQWLGK
jgi:hypothetical protein